MIEVINIIIGFYVNFPFVLYASVGYLTGYMVRTIGIIKIIILFFIVPPMLDHLIDINQLWVATLPYIVSAMIGYIGIDKARYYLMEASDILKRILGR